MILFPGLTVQYFRGSGGQQTFCSSIERWLKEYQFCNIAVVRIRTTALAAKFLRCQNAGEKKTAASWLHQLAREDQICSEKGMLFIARCAAREREASRAGCTASALQGVLPGGRESRGADSPSKIFETYFWGGPHFPDMSHGFRCARMTFSESNL